MIPAELTAGGWRESFRHCEFVLVTHDELFPRGEFDVQWALAYERARRAVAA